MPAPVVLCILDGWGLSPNSDVSDNAPVLANTPCFDDLWANRPCTTLSACGLAVGLPKGQVGNSEVGHTTIGAGRIVDTDLVRIDKAIANQDLPRNAAMQTFVQAMRDSGGKAHVLGLLSDGGVHSHQSHIFAVLKILHTAGVPMDVHMFTDGRDTAPKAAHSYLADLSRALPPTARLATIMGRYFAMDRDHRWDRTERAYRAIVSAETEHTANDSFTAVDMAYARGESDEFIAPTRIGDYQGVADGAVNGVVCVNYRADRVRQLLSAMVLPDFAAFARGGNDRDWHAVLGMGAYSDVLRPYHSVLFDKPAINDTLGSVIAKTGKTQFRIAETEKYPHVTFFLNCGVEQPYANEHRFMPHSPRVATYDLAPEMSADSVTDRCVGAIRAGYDFIVVNYANPDMVGHTGDLSAAIKACEAVDRGLRKVHQAVVAERGVMLITADHGNCEVMFDRARQCPHTAHTLNRVPAILVNESANTYGLDTRSDAGLSDLAPTVLHVLGLNVPASMTGKSLLLTA